MPASRLEAIVGRLQTFYGALPSPPTDPFALFVWGVLDARSAPRKRDAAMSALRRLPALTPDSLARAPQAKLEAAVALAGAYRDQRVEALRNGADLFRRRPRLPQVVRGPLREARRAIAPLPQVDRAAAHRMLLFAAHRPMMPVDARVHRVAARLGYGEAAVSGPGAMRQTRRRLEAELPRSEDAYRLAFEYLVHHAAATCTEGDPLCGICPVATGCPSSGWRPGGAAS